MGKKNNIKTNYLGVLGWLFLLIILIILLLQVSSGGLYIIILSTLALVVFWIDRIKYRNSYSGIGQYLSLILLIITIILYIIYFS